MQLFLIKPEEVGLAGSVQVGWCIERELLEEVKDKNPHVLIITAPVGRRYNKSREMRQIVPLKEGMTFVSFRVPGENTIRAKLLAGDTTDRYRFRYLEGESHYSDGTLNHEGTDWVYSLASAERELADALRAESELSERYKEGYPHAMSPESRITSARADVEMFRSIERYRAAVPVTVPKEAFAKEPPQWLQTWVNYFWRDRPKDDCGFIHRLPAAIFVQPFWMLWLIAMRLTLTVGAFALAAIPGLSLKAVLHPMTYRLKDNFEDSKEPFWLPVTYHNGKDRPWRLLLAPLTPISLLISFFAIGGRWGNDLPSVLLATVIGAYLIVGAIFAVMALFALVVNAGEIMDSVAQFINKMTGGANLDSEDFEALACEGDCPKDISYDKLPKSRRSLRLRMLNHKAGHCRPWVG